MTFILQTYLCFYFIIETLFCLFKASSRRITFFSFTCLSTFLIHVKRPAFCSIIAYATSLFSLHLLYAL